MKDQPRVAPSVDQQNPEITRFACFHWFALVVMIAIVAATA